MNRIILMLSCIILPCAVASGQKAPIYFGDVSMEDLQMTSYAADTSAPAVILCDYGIFTTVKTNYDAFGTTAPFKFTRIRRIKILKKEGYNWANSSYPCNINTEIKGVTFNLENGKVIKTKLKNESIFKDRLTEDIFVMRIAMPDVKVGSIIELQFNSVSPLLVWKFQEEIPVKYSELIMEDMQAVRFKSNFFGNEPLFLSTPNRWIAKNMPSFKAEPFMSSKENYITKLEFDFLDIGFQSIASSWENVNKLLLNDIFFGKALVSSGYLGSLAKSIKESNKSTEEMIKSAFDAVKSVIKWDENQSLFTSSGTLSFPYKMKIGNSADINLILLQLLRKLEFDAYPVAMSSRENGFLSADNPTIQKMNYVIVLVHTGDKTFLLDATEKYSPNYLLPFRCLNYNGRLISEKGSQSVTIGTTFKNKEFITYQLKINNDNVLEGSLMLKNVDYAALEFRNKYKTFNSHEEYLEDYLKDKQGLQIVESTIYNVDSVYLPLIEDNKVKINSQVNEIGDELYILPMIYHQLNENPFKTDTRRYPVDFGYNAEKTITSVLEIPENYDVSVLPASVKLKLQDNDATLTYIVNRSGKTINIKSVFAINKAIFLPEEYTRLKEFYNQVIKKHSEPIILKKI